jgi:hypothetical protein
MLPNYALDGRIDPAALQASIDQLNQRRSPGSKTITPGGRDGFHVVRTGEEGAEVFEAISADDYE